MFEKRIFQNRIMIEETKEEDLDQVIAIEGKEENRPFVYQWSKEDHRRTMASVDEMHLVIRNLEGKMIGYMILAGRTSPHLSFELMRITVDEKGKGYGKLGVQWVMEYCFEELNYHRLWLDVFTENTGAIALYDKLGFYEEGILRDCKKYGDRYRSMKLYSMLEEEYRECREKWN